MERFSVSWRRDATLARILRRLCRLNWKMLISIQPPARYSLSSERHQPPISLSLSLSFLSSLSLPFPETPFRPSSSILRDEIKAREGKFYFAALSLSLSLSLSFSLSLCRKGRKSRTRD